MFSERNCWAWLLLVRKGRPQVLLIGNKQEQVFYVGKCRCIGIFRSKGQTQRLLAGTCVRVLQGNIRPRELCMGKGQPQVLPVKSMDAPSLQRKVSMVAFFRKLAPRGAHCVKLMATDGLG